MSEFDFSNVSAPEAAQSYLQPGNYRLSVKDAKFERPEGKNAYLEITFSGKSGDVKEKFYITPKALNRLQYLHEAFIGKKLEKAFEGVDDVAAYFTKVFSSDKAKQIVKMMTVGGSESDRGTVFARLPYSNYVIPEGMNVVEGPFEKGSYDYNQYVKKAENASSNSDSVMLSETPASPASPSYDDDLPF